MRNKTTWATVSVLLVVGLTAAAAVLLSRQVPGGALLLVAAVIVAKDLASLSAASKARALRRDAYIDSGAWRSSAVGGGAAGAFVSIPSDSYFQRAFSSAPLINPATGFAMVGNLPGVDLAGNLYGHATMDGTLAADSLSSAAWDQGLAIDTSSDFSGTRLD